MKVNRTRFFAAGTALVVVLAVAAALAQGMHHHGGSMGDFGFGDHMFNYLSDALDLTQAQQDQAKAIREKDKATVQPLMKQLMQAHKDMSALEDSGTFDEAKVRALAAQNTPILTELFVQKARTHAELMQILTPEQKTKLAQLKAKHQSRMSEHMQNHDQE